MKKIIIFLLFPCLSYSQSSAYKQIKAYAMGKGYSISDERYADLAEGESAEYSKMFLSGLSYIIIAMSDDSDVDDIDVYLNNMNGNTYDKDADTSDIAVVLFEPSFSRKMRVVFKNYSSRTPRYESRCRLFIGYKY